MKQLVAIKPDGTITYLPYTIGARGFPNWKGRYFISSKQCQRAGIDPKNLIEKPPTHETEQFYLRMGINPDGIELIDVDEFEARRIRQAKEAETARLADMSPARRALEERINKGLREWDKVDEQLWRAERAAHSSDEDGWDTACRLRASARALAEKIMTEFPEATAIRKAKQLRLKADETRRKSKGALTYDADGWIDAAEQKRRHDEMLAKASEIEAEADRIEKEVYAAVETQGTASTAA